MDKQALDVLRQQELDRRSGLRATLYCCAGTSCLSTEGEHVAHGLREALASHAGLEDVEVVPTGCMGLCSEGPLVRVEVAGLAPVLYVRVTLLLARLIVAEHLVPALAHEGKAPFEVPAYLASHTLSLDMPFFKDQTRFVLSRLDRCSPERIADAVADGAYGAYVDCRERMTPEAVLQVIEASGLRGRGGGGYPTGRKWKNAARTEASRRFIICNGDEGDPGAYMDRSVLEGDPHAVLEGMLIAAYAVGAGHGYVYIRAEYSLAVQRMQRAIEAATSLGLLGEKAGFSCEVFLGGGAFVCGEETALIASIEGERGTPRPRPPYPSESGLFGCPTVINNVETLANVPRIFAEGSEGFRSIGTPESPGTKVFSLAGRSRYTGLLEVPMGMALRHLVETVAGGTSTEKPVRAVQTGGLSGGMIPESALDTPLTYEAMGEQGAIMGSGGMIVLDEDDDLLELALYYLDHAVAESCGRCAACRIGTRQLRDLAQGLRDAPDDPRKLALIARVIEVMQSASLCGLGKAAPRPLLSYLRGNGAAQRAEAGSAHG